MSALYATDFYAWTQHQAARLRAGATAELDLAHLAEEIDDMGKSAQRELAHRLAVLVTHLLKLWLASRRFQGDLARAGRGWRATVQTQRLQVAKVLRNNPSLRSTVPGEVGDAYAIARIEAPVAFEAGEEIVPDVCPWTVEQVLDAAFWPEDAA